MFSGKTSSQLFRLVTVINYNSLSLAVFNIYVDKQKRDAIFLMIISLIFKSKSISKPWHTSAVRVTHWCLCRHQGSLLVILRLLVIMTRMIIVVSGNRIFVLHMLFRACIIKSLHGLRIWFEIKVAQVLVGSRVILFLIRDTLREHRRRLSSNPSVNLLLLIIKNHRLNLVIFPLISSISLIRQSLKNLLFNPSLLYSVDSSVHSLNTSKRRLGMLLRVLQCCCLRVHRIGRGKSKGSDIRRERALIAFFFVLNLTSLPIAFLVVRSCQAVEFNSSVNAGSLPIVITIIIIAYWVLVNPVSFFATLSLSLWMVLLRNALEILCFWLERALCQ